MSLLSTLAILASAATSGQTTLLDFYSPQCGPCRTMHPTVQQLADAGHPVQQIDVTQHPDLAARHGVGLIPCFVMLVDGREVDRVVGATSHDRLLQMLRHAEPRPAASAPAAKTAHAAAPLPLVPISQNHLAVPVAPASPGRLVQIGADRPAAAGSDAVARAKDATVRLRVEDAAGYSYGTGTVVDMHGADALVLTCAHIFRDSNGQGAITVDVFPGQDGTLRGELIAWDLPRDVALVAFRPGRQIAAMPVAPAGYTVRSNDPVFGFGCDKGGPPTVHQTRVSAVNGLLGHPTIEVVGQPVDGRSGGGLFSADGQLLGVCNAADPTDNEGLFAGLESVHAALDRANLAFVYQKSPDSVPQDAGGVADIAQLPSQPATIPPLEAAPPLANLGSPPAATGRLSSAEQELLQALDEKPAEAEVICIIRSRTNPDAPSRVIQLERPSSAFLDRLSDRLDQQRAVPQPR